MGRGGGMERSVRLSRRRRGSDRGGAGSRAITFGRWDGMGSVSVGPRSFKCLHVVVTASAERIRFELGVGNSISPRQSFSANLGRVPSLPHLYFLLHLCRSYSLLHITKSRQPPSGATSSAPPCCPVTLPPRISHSLESQTPHTAINSLCHFLHPGGLNADRLP